jgi:hypothetical protein
MISLQDVTFIIPIRIDSEDRIFNLQFVLNWLMNNLETKVIIKESGPVQRVPDLIKTHHRMNSHITYQFENTDSQIFHRTRLINEMLATVRTPIVANCDIDIFVLPYVYLHAKDKIMRDGFDIVYPYFRGDSQYKINHEAANKLLQTGKLDPNDFRMWHSVCGHCQFIKTSAYLKIGMENENFISWGAEDSERMYRFFKLGYKMAWLDNYVYHIEHQRGINSGENNPQFQHNEALYRELWCKNEFDLLQYYNNVEYRKKYSLSLHQINPHI